MENLTFRVTPGQLRGLVILGIITTAITAVAILYGVHGGFESQGTPIAVALGAGFGALVTFYSCWVYSRAYTECTPTTLRTRGYRSHECAWKDVTQIYIHRLKSQGSTTYSIRVRTATGKRFKLALPVTGGVMRDPQFGAKLMGIEEYWHAVLAENERTRAD
jgi:hypothetical protein